MDASAAPGPPPLPPRAGMRRFQRLRVLFALVVREMGTKFGRSAGGYFWAIAEPVGGIALLSLAFSFALRAPPLGASFVLFYTTGVVPYSVFRALSGEVAGAVRSNRGLLTYPVVTALDAVFAKALLACLTVALVALVLYSGIFLIFDLHANIDVAAVVLGFALAALVGLGVGTLNCVLFGFFPTWRNVWGIVTRPLFIVSGVLFLYEAVPRSVAGILWYNPLTHAIGLTRAGFYSEYDPQYVSVAYVLGVSLTLFAVGAYLLRRHASFLIDQ